MKKLVFLLAGGMFIASCNRDQSTLAPAGTSDESQMNLEHYEKSDLDGMITPMNQNFGFISFIISIVFCMDIQKCC